MFTAYISLWLPVRLSTDGDWIIRGRGLVVPAAPHKRERLELNLNNNILISFPGLLPRLNPAYPPSAGRRYPCVPRVFSAHERIRLGFTAARLLFLFLFFFSLSLSLRRAGGASAECRRALPVFRGPSVRNPWPFTDLTTWSFSNHAKREEKTIWNESMVRTRLTVRFSQAASLRRRLFRIPAHSWRTFFVYTHSTCWFGSTWHDVTYDLKCPGAMHLLRPL